MKELNVNLINRSAPYGVRVEDDKYWFHTDHGIVYVVDFEEEDIFDVAHAYRFGLYNRSNRPSPNDAKVRATVICIIEEFFRVNPDILLYMCDSAGNQQEMRHRLFLRWFNGYEQQKRYCLKTAIISDEGVLTYVAILLQRANPHLNRVISQFEEQIALFKENKP